MSLHAVEAVGDAVEATQAFLLPFDRSRWLRLALVVLFVGGGFGLQFPLNTGSSTAPSVVDADTGPVQVDSPADLSSIPEDVWLVVGAVVAAAVVLGLLFGFVGATMAFVFVESLRRDEVHVRAYFRQYWTDGLRLLGFRLGVGALGLGTLAAVGLAVFGGVPTDPQPARVFGAILVLVPVGLVVFILLGLINGFTTAFVVPVMVAEDRTVLEGWRRFWPTLRGQPKQYGAYVLVGFLLTVAVGIVSATAISIGAVALAIPFVIVGGLVFVAGGTSLSLSVGVVLGLLVVVYVAVLVTLAALVQVPLQTFMRCYTLLFLGDTDEAFDLIPDLRAEIRG